jgi:hypothetical protein
MTINDSLNFATLEQGKIYKRLQNKLLDESLEIRDKKKKRGSVKEGLTVFEKSYNTVTTSEPSVEKTQKLTSLQQKFNYLLTQYQQLENSLSTSIKNYSGSKGQNVYVNTIINNPQASYVGVFKDSPPLMSVQQNGSQTFTFDSCMKTAINAGKTYFGLENADTSKKLAQCNIGSDLTVAEKYGAATNGCQKGADGKMYGQFNNNVTALYSTNNSAYQGCYYNSGASGPSMTDSGIPMQNYTPVYTLGALGIGPWGSGSFPDKTAQWIWYSSGAQNGAPVNIGSPMTFIYEYNYNGTNYIDATVYAMNDDVGTWYLNSIKAATVNGGWDNKTPQFTIRLAPGMNYLQCEAVNNSGPAGLIASVMYNGQVLFNTNSDWRYTNLPVHSMVIAGSNYSVDTCQQYAKQNSFSYFGLKNGTSGTSQCVVSNSLQEATKYGSSDPTVTFSDNRAYGLKTANAIYQLNNQNTDPSLVGKMGYVDSNYILSEYPSSMIQKSDSSTIPTIVGSDPSCPTKVTPIDSGAWNVSKKSGKMGKMMTPTTKCGLAASTANLQDKMNHIKGQLATVADQILVIINELKTSNQNIVNQGKINETSISQNVEMYKNTSQQFGQYKYLINNNSGLMVDDSTNLLNHENFKYIFWGVLATVVVITTVKLVKNS